MIISKFILFLFFHSKKFIFFFILILLNLYLLLELKKIFLNFKSIRECKIAFATPPQPKIIIL